MLPEVEEEPVGKEGERGHLRAVTDLPADPQGQWAFPWKLVPDMALGGLLLPHLNP